MAFLEDCKTYLEIETNQYNGHFTPSENKLSLEPCQTFSNKLSLLSLTSLGQLSFHMEQLFPLVIYM